MRKSFKILHKSLDKIFRLKLDLKEVGHVVFYHNDLDGAASACLFNLRGVTALGLDPERVVYLPVTYDKEILLDNVYEVVKKHLGVDHIQYIFLDIRFNSKFLAKDTPIDIYLTVDHHADYPGVPSKICLHDPDSPACAEMIVKAFPNPNPLENLDNVRKLIHSVRVVDTGGTLDGYKVLEEVVSEIPGCLIFYNVNENVTTKDTLRLLQSFISGSLTEHELDIFKGLLDQTKRLLKYMPEPDLTWKVGDKNVCWINYGASRSDSLKFAIATFRSNTNFLCDISFISQQVGENMFRVSLRTGLKNFDVNAFCKRFKGGGRKSGAGGFLLTTTNLGREIEIILSELGRFLEVAQ